MNAALGSLCMCAVCLQVSSKLTDKERTLEEEIQLRERIQLQCKQAERKVDDLHMEMQTTMQARDDLTKQVKQAQVQFKSSDRHILMSQLSKAL